MARAISIQGQVEHASAGESVWTPVRQNETFCPGDRLRVGANSRAGLTLNDNSLLRLAENSSVRLSAPAEDGRAWLDLLQGIAHFISRVRNSFQVNTPYVNASIEGTEFTVESAPDKAGISVLEGRVRASNDQGEVLLSGGQRAVALPGKAPRMEAVVDPLDAVQWALYYPRVTAPTVANPSTDIQQSFEAHDRGDLDGAFSVLSKVPHIEQDAALLVYRASLHLQVGGTSAARRDLARAIQLAPDHADALALMSIIASVHSQRQEALELAQRAVRADPEAASPLLALSYARQAQFQLPDALAAARQATKVAPANPLTWSRLAQLHLMFQRTKAATEAARRAVEIAPEQPQTLTTLGFAQLIRFDTETAKLTFERAASIDQAAPLPRLGLCLALIREGKLGEGRQQLETAANMDPGNALIRSYLGKAYYEETRDQRAATQFALAKRFDELDPTAWFYDAILKQSANRPIEALNDLQTSIDLNDNRAVYRSRLLLDQDEAARNTSQARIFQELEFDQLARTEAYKSLQSNPETHSAHRLISDSYIGKPSYQGARVSELLQSQLLQPLNTSPIQPQLAVSNLGILDGTGPSSGGFSEYTPLFTRNGANIQFNTIGGNNSTVGSDLVLSGLRDRYSYSLGHFHHESDGWRDNNDIKQDIYNAFLQASLSPNTSIQFEYLNQDFESGDLGLAFDLALFSPIERNFTERTRGRIGLHHQPTEESDLIASLIYQELLQTNTVNATEYYPSITTPYGILPGTVEQVNISTNDSIARTAELQYIQHLGEHIFTVGAGNYNEDRTDSNRAYQTLTLTGVPIPPYYVTSTLGNPPSHRDIDPKLNDLYIYSQLALPYRINLTLGATYADYKSSIIDVDQVDPKFGLTWEPWQDVIFRAAYLENIAHPANLEQTIQPTQVAGFNQFFDDIQGSKIEQASFGVDLRANASLYLGADYNQRDIEAPLYSLTGSAPSVLENQNEHRYQAYVYWTPTNKLALHLSYENEQFERDLWQPESLDTQRVPIGFNYHWQSGLYVEAVGTYVNQEINQSGTIAQDEFWSLDSVIGYRLPMHLGKTEIIVKNLLDEEFEYYDMNFRSWEPMLPKFQPERQIFMRLTINF